MTYKFNVYYVFCYRFLQCSFWINDYRINTLCEIKYFFWFQSSAYGRSIFELNYNSDCGSKCFTYCELRFNERNKLFYWRYLGSPFRYSWRVLNRLEIVFVVFKLFFLLCAFLVCGFHVRQFKTNNEFGCTSLKFLSNFAARWQLVSYFQNDYSWWVGFLSAFRILNTFCLAFLVITLIRKRSQYKIL